MIDQIWIISNDINENKNKVNVIFHFQGKYTHTKIFGLRVNNIYTIRKKVVTNGIKVTIWS